MSIVPLYPRRQVSIPAGGFKDLWSLKEKSFRGKDVSKATL